MSILDDDINLNMGIINHTCKLYIKKYGVNAQGIMDNDPYGINFQETIDNDPLWNVGDILHESVSIDNHDKLFVYWAYMRWTNFHPIYKLLITDIVPKTVPGQRDVLIQSSILKRDDLFYRPCTKRGYLLSLSDIMNEINN